jgi:transposase
MVQLRDLIVTAPEPLCAQLSEPKTIRGKANLCRRLRPAQGELELPSQAARFVLRSLARRIQTLDEEIAALDKQLERLVRGAAPRTTALLGISTGHAGQPLVSAGQNIERLRGESSFAALCGASPIPASSGKTSRHRLNYGGDRDANRALHLIAACRLRYCPRTRAYAQRRPAEGKTKSEIIRCLKRYIARETHHTLTADLTSPRRQQPPRRVTTIYCGAGPIGITRRRFDIYRNVK